MEVGAVSATAGKRGISHMVEVEESSSPPISSKEVSKAKKASQIPYVYHDHQLRKVVHYVLNLENKSRRSTAKLHQAKSEVGGEGPVTDLNVATDWQTS